MNRCQGRKAGLGYGLSARIAFYFNASYIGPTDAQVVEIELAHLFRAQQIAAIDDDRIAQQAANASVIQMFELIPLRQHQKSVSPLRGVFQKENSSISVHT
jgi:hypothetical protein